MYQELAVQTQIQEFVEVPVSTGELKVWLKHGIVAQRVPTGWLSTVPKATASDVAYLIASALEAPLVRGSVKIRGQVGRFVQVQYLPRSQSDPTAVVSLIPGAQRYHVAALRFSRLATRVTNLSWNGNNWYDDMRTAGRRVVAELAQLQPCVEEAKLVMNWLLDRITYGEPRNSRAPFPY